MSRASNLEEIVRGLILREGEELPASDPAPEVLRTKRDPFTFAPGAVKDAPKAEKAQEPQKPKPRLETWQDYVRAGGKAAEKVALAFPELSRHLGIDSNFKSYVRWYYGTIKRVNGGRHIGYTRAINEMLAQIRDRIKRMSKEEIEESNIGLNLRDIRSLIDAGSRFVETSNANVLIGWDTRTGGFPTDKAIDSARIIARRPTVLAQLQSDEKMASSGVKAKSGGA